MDTIFVVIKQMILVALIGELILYLNPSVIYEKFMRILLDLILFTMLISAVWNWKSTNNISITDSLWTLQAGMEEKMEQMDTAILQNRENLASSIWSRITQSQPASQYPAEDQINETQTMSQDPPGDQINETQTMSQDPPGDQINETQPMSKDPPGDQINEAQTALQEPDGFEENE